MQYRLISHTPNDFSLVCMLHPHSIFAHCVFRGTSTEIASLMAGMALAGIPLNFY